MTVRRLDRRVSEVRIPHARLIVAAAALAGCATILWLARGLNFYFDEWSFIFTAPDWTWTSFLEPHNEHPVIFPRLIYAVLLNTFGLHTYLPYMAVLLALHAASVVLLFELVRRRAGDLVGVGAAAVFLLLGAGWENLLWAFQVAFVGAVACGLGAMLALESRRTWLAAGLLLASVMFSAIGLVFVAAAAVRLVADSGRRREVLWLAPVAVAFAAWYLAFGHNGESPATPPTAANLVVLPVYVLWGLATSAAALIGQGGFLAPVALVLVAIALGLAWRRRRPDPFAIGVAAALLTLYVLAGLGRAQLGYQQGGASRYVYEGAALWLLLLADAARSLPWRGTWRPALVACVFLACFSGAVLLYAYAAAKTEQMRREDADLQALAALRSDQCLDDGAEVDPLVMPYVTPAAYYRAFDRYGDPVAGLPGIGGEDYERARSNLLRPGCA